MELEAITKRIQSLMQAQRDKDRGWSYASLARSIGVSKETPRHWHDGRAWPKIENLKNLAVALETTPLFIMFGIDERLPTGTVRVILTNKEHELLQALRAIPEDAQEQAIAYLTFLSQQASKVENVTPLLSQKT